MAKHPYMPLWTDAYLADTRHLTTVEHGAYLLLLMEAWRRPRHVLPDNDPLLARLACATMPEWAKLKPVVMSFWELDGRRKEWTQKRLAAEAKFVANFRASQRDRARKGWNKRKNADAGAMPERCPNDAPTPTPTLNKKKDSTSPKKTTNGDARKATRLPLDWKPDAQLVDYALDRGLNPKQILEDFTGHWWSVKPSKATKVHWGLVWQRWCRVEAERKHGDPNGPKRPPDIRSLR